MKTTPLKQSLKEPHLKVIKNKLSKKQQKMVSIAKVYINTLAPNFSYNNEKGEEITRNNCIML